MPSRKRTKESSNLAASDKHPDNQPVKRASLGEFTKAVAVGLFSSFMGILSIAVMSGLISDRIEWNASKNWPFTWGVMSEPAYGPLGFDYEVDGRQFNSDRLVLTNIKMTQDEWRLVKDRYPAGNEVKVFYNPQHPEKAFLERGKPPVVFLILVLPLISLLTISFGLLCIQSGFKYLKTGERSDLPL
jgi:hypothetical protein